MYKLWAVLSLYLDNIVLGIERRGRSPRAAVAGCSFVQWVTRASFSVVFWMHS